MCFAHTRFAHIRTRQPTQITAPLSFSNSLVHFTLYTHAHLLHTYYTKQIWDALRTEPKMVTGVVVDNHVRVIMCVCACVRQYCDVCLHACDVCVCVRASVLRYVYLKPDPPTHALTLYTTTTTTTTTTQRSEKMNEKALIKKGAFASTTKFG